MAIFSLDDLKGLNTVISLSGCEKIRVNLRLRRRLISDATMELRFSTTISGLYGCCYVSGTGLSGFLAFPRWLLPSLFSMIYFILIMTEFFYTDSRSGYGTFGQDEYKDG